MDRETLFVQNLFLPTGFVIGGLLASLCVADLRAVEEALVASSWQTVHAVCRSEKSNIKMHPAVLNGIMGHACLALNLNNDSLGHFVTLANDPNSNQWQKWASRFSRRNPLNARALYLEGDALARLGRWHAAERLYSNALGVLHDFGRSQRPATAPSPATGALRKVQNNLEVGINLNARGVAHACQGDFVSALKDLEDAIHVTPNLADPYASLGTVLVLKQAPEGAIYYYEQALQRCATFALARNGRACAKIGYRTDASTQHEVIQDLVYAVKYRSTEALATFNIELLAQLAKGSVRYPGATSEGMTLTAKEFRDMDAGLRRKIMRTMPLDKLNKIIDKSGEN